MRNFIRESLIVFLGALVILALCYGLVLILNN